MAKGRLGALAATETTKLGRDMVSQQCWAASMATAVAGEEGERKKVTPWVQLQSSDKTLTRPWQGGRTAVGHERKKKQAVQAGKKRSARSVQSSWPNAVTDSRPCVRCPFGNRWCKNHFQNISYVHLIEDSAQDNALSNAIDLIKKNGYLYNNLNSKLVGVRSLVATGVTGLCFS